MALSPYTFKGAMVLLDPDQRTRTALEKVFGTALFVGAGAAAIAGGPVVGIGAAAWLALVDPKNDAAALLTPAVAALTRKLRGTADMDQLELIAAAHTITVMSSFFDTLPDVLGKAYGDLKLTDREKDKLTEPADGTLLDVDVRLSSPELGLNENIERNLAPYFERLAQRCIDFFSGLEAWERVRRSAPADPVGAIVDGSVHRYRSRMLELGTSAPFALWLTLNEFTATQTQAAQQTAALEGLRTVLSIAMGTSTAEHNSYRRKLALAAQEVLDEPLLRSRPTNIASPTVRDGFVEPAFRHAVAQERSRPADEGWWRQQPEDSSLIDLLAGYLASPQGAELPLLLLGHPGAGKSLLTEVLAAQLPPESFAVVRVPLRSVNPDDDLTMQITKELQRTLQRPNADLDELRQELGPCTECEQGRTACPHRCHLVVLLDGFDELVQATGVTQSAYLTKVVAFQKRARTLGTPTSVIVTSRTVVADRAEIPAGTPMIKLLEFDKGRIQRWLTAWNVAHSEIAGFVPLDIGEMTVDDDQMTTGNDIADLSRQPLLLLMLAVYLAELGTNKLTGSDLTQSELYERILDRFISRQITEKTAPDQPAEAQRILEAQQRRQLQYAAIGMFNRGRQHVSDIELNADLAALEPPRDAAAGIQPLTPADRVLGEFMFVHNPRADREQRSAYEFLHATFGEFLVAELVLQQLIRLMRHRALESDPTLQPSGLDDSLLRRLLSHQPLTTRGPVLSFLGQLSVRRADHGDGLRATIGELLRRELNRPDSGDQLYHPLPYDPVRRRACYTANLTILRILLDPEPVRVEVLLGRDSTEQWIRTVRLWRAGIDTPAWNSIMQFLMAAPSDDPPAASEIRIMNAFEVDGAAQNEAELVGDRILRAELLIGARLVGPTGGQWRRADLEAMKQISTILFASTGTPYLGRLLPFDFGWYQAVYKVLADQPTVNKSVRSAIVMLLSRSASLLPVDYIRDMLRIVLPHPVGREFELATVAASHPVLLDESTGLVDHIRAAEREVLPAIVALLWRAEQQHEGDDRNRLHAFRSALDLTAAGLLPYPCNHEYFAPEFVTYLRLEQPEHWIEQPQVPALFDELENNILASIAASDVLFVATTWPEEAEHFVVNYLRSRGVTVAPDDGLLDLLRGLSDS